MIFSSCGDRTNIQLFHLVSSVAQSSLSLSPKIHSIGQNRSQLSVVAKINCHKCLNIQYCYHLSTSSDFIGGDLNYDEVN